MIRHKKANAWKWSLSNGFLSLGQLMGNKFMSPKRFLILCGGALSGRETRDLFPSTQCLINQHSYENESLCWRRKHRDNAFNKCTHERKMESKPWDSIQLRNEIGRSKLNSFRATFRAAQKRKKELTSDWHGTSWCRNVSIWVSGKSAWKKTENHNYMLKMALDFHRFHLQYRATYSNCQVDTRDDRTNTKPATSLNITQTAVWLVMKWKSLSVTFAQHTRCKHLSSRAYASRKSHIDVGSRSAVNFTASRWNGENLA